MGALIIVLVAVFPILAGLFLFERSPRRSALATLRVAVSRPPSSTGGSATKASGEPPRPDQAVQLPTGAQVVLDRIAAAVARPLRRLCPPGYLASTQRRLTLAGRDRPRDADIFFTIRFLSLSTLGPIFLLILLVPPSGLFSLLAFVLSASLLGLGPEAALNRAVTDRQERIRHDLPALVELLMISVEAGLGFDQALARAVATVPGPLSEEFSRFLGEVRIGAEQKSALEAVDRRTDVDELRSFLMALVQAATFGVSVGPILRSQAERIRMAQRQHVQELAQKAPVKLLFPLVFCVLPALFIVVIGPAAIEIQHTLVHFK